MKMFFADCECLNVVIKFPITGVEEEIINDTGYFNEKQTGYREFIDTL